MKKNNKRGLTDKISIAVAVFVVLSFLFAAALMWKTGDTSGLAYFLPSVAGFGTIVLTSIVNKNKREKELMYSNEEVR